MRLPIQRENAMKTQNRRPSADLSRLFQSDIQEIRLSVNIQNALNEISLSHFLRLADKELQEQPTLQEMQAVILLANLFELLEKTS